MDYINNLFSSLTASVGELIPGIAGALVVLLVGWLAAIGIRKLVRSLIQRTGITEKLGNQQQLPHFIAKLAYYLVLLYTLLLVLDIMGIEGVLAPLTAMLNEFLGFLPNLIAAGVIGFVGYTIAQIASEAVALFSQPVQRFSQRIGLSTNLNLANILKQIVFFIVFLPLIITALDTLKMTAISAPATAMLNDLLGAIPKILSATLIIGLVYIIGRYVANLITKLLTDAGVNEWTSTLGLSNITSPYWPLSRIIGQVVFVFILFGGVVAGVEKLAMPQLTIILTDLLTLTGKIGFGLIILVFGNVLANWAKRALLQSDTNPWFGSLIQMAILFVFIALGLNTMGVGTAIVNLAFGLVLGALAVAFALAYGLGGREAAGKHLANFLERFRNSKIEV